MSLQNLHDTSPKSGKLHYTFNSHGRNKDFNKKLLTEKFEDTEGTLEDVRQHILAGHAICAGQLDGAARASENVIGSHWVLIDADNSAPLLDENGEVVRDENGKTITRYTAEFTIEAALAHPFVQQHCSFIYTTASHSPEHHKIRLIFLLPEYEHDKEVLQEMIRMAQEILPHDPNCKDIGRVFYGNTNAEIPLWNPDAQLPAEWRDRAVERVAERKRQQELLRREHEARQVEYQRKIENREIDPRDTDELILSALDAIPPRQIGGNTYHDCIRVLMALVSHYGELEAERIAESWSPSQRGTNWNISKMIRSLRGGRDGGVGIGTLFYIAQQHGWKFPAREKKQRDRNWNEPDDAAYQQYIAQHEEQERLEDVAADFERERRKREWHERLWRELNPPLDAYVWGQSYQEAPSPQSLWDLKYKPSKVVHQRYLNLEGIDISFLCLVSAMNTGKTQALVDLASNPNDSLLIVVNTVALAEALAVRYNCRCYNEDEINLGEVNRLAITADSLWKIPTLNKRFKFVVIDEADQVTAHLANGGTCKRNRGRIIASFNYFAATAEVYVLADADLSGTVIDWHAHTRKRSPFILKNTYKPCEGRIAYQFSSQVALFEYGCQLLEEGKRVLFATDAKSTVKKAASRLTGTRTIEGIENLEEEVYQKLESRFPNKKGRQIHGDNSSEANVRAFIKNINNSLKYIPLDYLIYNSSMGSGVSIDVEAFDAVIVLASGYTLPHTELGQLAHRYRPTTEFCFWVNGDGLKGLETNCYRVASDFLYKNRASGLSLEIDPNTGMVGINNPDFLALVASLEARRNWSLMNIAMAFTGHLERMGYQIEPHPDEELLTELDGATEQLKEHKRVVEAAEKASICKAIELNPEQYESLKNSPTTDFYERCALQKYELHEFYDKEVTEELIDQDDAGSLRRSLTRLDILLNPESIARRMDLSDRRSHHVITDLKHYKLQRDLLSDLGLLEFIDPAKEYHAHDLIALGERARLKAIDIKKILSITISVAPRRLRECRIFAHKGIKSLFSPETNFAHKWLISALANGAAQKFAAKKFADQEQANEYCSQLSPAAKLVCEAISVEKRFGALEATDSQVHAALCGAVGLKRKNTRQSKKEGRFYQIVPETWKFASEVLVHRQEQRDQRLLAREEELQEEAKRFDHLEPEQIQAEIEAEIAAVKSSEAPALVFLAEQWIKFAAELGNSGRAAPPAKPLDAPALILLLEWWIKITDILEKSNSGNTPPRKMNFTNKPGGGVTKSRRVAPGDEVRVGHTTIPHCPIPELPNQTLIVEQQASGVSAESHEYHDYLKIKIPDGGSYWVPAEWLESLDGLPVRRDPDAYTPRTPTSTIRTWRYWLLGVRSPEELEQFESRRNPKELQAIADSLVPEQLTSLQHQLQDWGITRDWLLMTHPANEHLPQEIGEWLEACVELGDDAAPDALADAVETLRTQSWFSTARSHIWNYLSAQIKAAIVRLSFNSYEILAGVS